MNQQPTLRSTQNLIQPLILILAVFWNPLDSFLQVKVTRLSGEGLINQHQKRVQPIWPLSALKLS